MTAAAVADQVLELGDGRALGFKVYGDPAGVPLLFLHGTPGSRLKFAIGHDAGKELGLAIVAPDRWGYGLSDVPDAPRLPAFAADMAALMDHLGHAQFAVGGISGGSPYAASVAAGLASRVTALALVSPMGPIDDPACRRLLSRFHRFAFTVLPGSPRATAAVFAAFRASLERSPRLAAQLATLRAGARDKALLARPEIARWLLGSFREGLRRSVAGPVCDLQLFSRSWGVDLGAIGAPAHLWIGTADTAVPIGAARLLARSIAACAVTELPADGHFWVAANYRDVLEWIAETAGPGDEDASIIAGRDKTLKVLASPVAPSNASRATDVRPARYARKVRTRP